jgi:hypothetical protein
MRIQENSLSQLLTLIKPIGKGVPLRVGEIIEAQIVDVFPGGGLTLKVKGSYFPVRTDLVFDIDDIVSLKVLAQGGAGKELILELLGDKNRLIGDEPRNNPAPGGNPVKIGNLVQKVLDQIANLVAPKGDGAFQTGSQADQSSDLRQLRVLLRDLINALPSETHLLPREIKAQIQQVLLASSPLKGSGLEDQAGDLILQLLKNKIGLGEEGWPKASAWIDQDRITVLTQKASDQILTLISQGQEEVAGPGALPQRSAEVGKLRVLLGDLLKSLPADIQSLPRGLRTEIQLIFQASLKDLGQDVQQKTVQLMDQLPEGLTDASLIQTLKNSLVSMEGLHPGKLKEALENSGVVLEAKLKALAEGLPQEGKGVVAASNTIQKDLKAVLLQLKEILQEKSSPDSSVGFIQRWLDGVKQSHGEEIRPYQKELGGVETLLKDVETFQLLSKVSDSFYTYLPVQWLELKRGELVFKRRRQPSGGSSYSCGIHLDLERLGPVSVLITMQHRDFFITFKVDHQELNSLIHSHLAELKENFRQEGLNLKTVTSMMDKGDFPDPFDRIESDEPIVSIRI